jgi:hypothetical protein
MASRRRLRRQAEKKSKLDALTLCTRKCESKQPFNSRAEAEHNMERLKASIYYDGRELNVYICPLAPEEYPHYHFGHV